MAITLLILNLKVPSVPPEGINGQLASKLLSMWHPFVSYVMSFMIIGIFWIMHHRVFRHIARYSEVFMFINLLFLMLVVFIPFTTNLYSTYRTSRAAFTVYGGSMGAVSFMLCLMWLYALGNKRLISEELEPPDVREAVLQSMLTAVIFFGAVGVAYLNLAAARALIWTVFPLVVVIDVVGSRKFVKIHE